jgi:hypothetical protein
MVEILLLRYGPTQVQYVHKTRHKIDLNTAQSTSGFEPAILAFKQPETNTPLWPAFIFLINSEICVKLVRGLMLSET